MNRIYVLMTVIGTVLLGSHGARGEAVGGSMTLNASWNMYLAVLVDKTTDTAHIQISGPDNKWFAVGFNSTSMNGTYTIITDGNGTVTERRLGSHTSGSQLTSSVTVHSVTAQNGVRTVYLTRPRVGSTQSHYTFSDTADTINLIFARGNGSSLSYHGSSNKNNQLKLTKEVPDSPSLAIAPHALSEVELRMTNLVYGVKNVLDVSGTLSSNEWTTAEVIELAPPGSGPVDWLFSTNVLSTATNDVRFFRIRQ